MDKSNFKKLALMGMVGGVLVANQVPVEGNEGVSMGASMSAHGCGNGSCGGSKPHASNGSGQSSLGGGSCGSKPQPNPQPSNAGQGNLGGGSCGSKPQSNAQKYTADASTDAKYASSNKAMNETELFNQLNEHGKQQYRGLDAEGKALALKLASQTQDKNQAVNEAAQQMALKRSTMK